MLAARLGKSAGLQTRHGSPMNLTKRTELRRIPDRGSHDWGTIDQILDAGFLAHVGFCVDGQPFVIPTLYGRDGEKLYLNGSAAMSIALLPISHYAACAVPRARECVELSLVKWTGVRRRVRFCGLLVRTRARSQF